LDQGTNRQRVKRLMDHLDGGWGTPLLGPKDLLATLHWINAERFASCMIDAAVLGEVFMDETALDRLREDLEHFRPGFEDKFRDVFGDGDLLLEDDPRAP
jgi:hypothetical protein